MDGRTARTKRMRGSLCVGLGLWIGLLGLPARSWASPQAQPSGPAETRPADGKANKAHAYFTDVELLNQDGKPMRFYTDLLKGKVVVINSFYTSCTDSCPLIMGSLARLQDALGDRFGREVYFVSLTTDPTHDTPPRLKEYAKRFQAGAGWHLLTGKKENVGLALAKIAQPVKSREGHLNILIIGNERKAHWKKAFAMAPTPALVQMLDSVMEDR